MEQKRKFNIDKLREYRLRNGISQTHIAKELGYKSSSGYANIENKRVALTFETALKIAEILNEDLENLFYDKLM